MSINSITLSADPVLLMDNACLDFGGGSGVFDLNFALPKGSILGMIGPSGCGKTTTIRLFNGVYRSTSGTVRVFGQDPQKFSEADKARIGYIPQHFILYPNLNVEENMHFIGSIYGMRPAERTAKMQPLLEFVNLTEARKRLARKLSGGMQRRLALAGALLHDPDLLMADEPTAGIDPILRARIWENFRQLRDQGKTLLVTTQYVGEAAYCDQVAVMSQGRLITVDTPTGLQHQAMGGEVIHLQVEANRLAECRRFVDDLPQVKNVQRVDQESDGLYVLVDDAGQQLPIVLALLREKLSLTPRVAEPYRPPFDEVFVRLIQSAEHRRAAERRQAAEMQA
jgi:ABC-2 type transport system ATP-binding protein